MNISRKEFLRQGLLSLGKTVYTVADALKLQPEVEVGRMETAEHVPSEPDARMAVADNRFCLAGNCGCFTCLESCEQQAIQLVVGTGIRVDSDSCTGCGTCVSICPVTPRGIVLQPRAKLTKASTDQEDDG